MSLQLEKDAKVSIQTHIDEFSSRFSILIVLWLMVSLIWMLRVDLVLEYVVDVLDPCNSNNCSNLYNPAKCITRIYYHNSDNCFTILYIL